ncbi:hypothetical protein BS333_21450 (plasmid) [Vibrio azureus]|uniref:Peptidase S1 domain-containing protein n=1 Tax=Vibrio azureus NBRC 104587 TaxID=1219077 RepID=U3C456_9VIBR|nr:trypsin-like serine protease [Vibrio azureus]AUI88949.1 hypothetical protein BS333_21450 [Vibrio azureus]GAD76214.1 hypothetical protein VAZ01S_039_00390 [Vibrio azureus NBRC 104587]
MKPSRALLVTAALTSTTPAWAVVNGEEIVWQDHDNVVSLSHCTGTRIGRNFVLTAAHCHEGDVQISYIKDVNNEDIQLVDSVAIHPNYVPTRVSEDIALVKLTEATNVKKVQFFKDLSETTYVQDAPFSLLGFGGGNPEPTHASFQLKDKVDNYPVRIEAVQTGRGQVTNGDSGSAWVDENNLIFAVLSGTTLESTPGENKQIISGRDLHYAADFILENVDGWHYPTIADADGKTTIEVQSLHRDNVTDSAYVTGDATLITEESTCLNGPIKPFGRCTYVIDSNGRKAKLHLSESEVVRINPNAADATDNTDNAAANPDTAEGTKSGKSGGSLGLISLSLLAIFGTLRRKKVRFTRR